MLFIVFNGGGLTKEQWIKHPYENMKSKLINKLKKLGKVYLYTPNFTFTAGTQYSFNLSNLDIEKHCKKIYNIVSKLDNEFIIISHSRGWMFSHVFIKLYNKQIKGYINCDGGYTDNYFKNYLKINKKYSKIKDDQLMDYLYKFNTNSDKTAKSEISNIVTYNIFKQYKKTHIDKKYKFNWFILNNIHNNSEINLSMDDYVKSTLDDKLKFNDTLEKYDNITSMYFVNKSHFLYFYLEDLILQLCNDFC